MVALNAQTRRQSLQDLDGQEWGEAAFGSYVVRTVHSLRRKPLLDFTVEDLRLMIGQAEGLPYLVPLAIERLQEDPLVDGDFYPGDLLMAVLKVESSFWHAHPDLRRAVEGIARKALTAHIQSDELESRIAKDIEAALVAFLSDERASAS